MAAPSTRNDSFLARLAEMERTYRELSESLAMPEVYSNPTRMLEVQRALGRDRRMVEAYQAYLRLRRELDETRELAASGDADLAAAADDEARALAPRVEQAIEGLRDLIAEDDVDAHRSAILEIRAGTGGDEATLFAADLLRMYARYAERRGWRVEMISESRSEVGGIKEATLNISGEGAFHRLRWEGGVHRVQRVPTTEAQGRIHTSTATVAILPEAEEIEIELKPEEIFWEAFRASGAGGQHVNRTDSAIRMIHVPTGIKVECQDERSQHKNRVRAEKLLRAKLYDYFQTKADAERASARRALVGSGDRSEKIRTYNFPDSRVKDHRINFMIHDVEGMLQGGLPLDEMLEALRQHAKEERLKQL